MSSPVVITDELMIRLLTAQLNHLKEMLNSDYYLDEESCKLEDDGGDYLSAALELSHTLYELTALSNYDAKAWNILLNTPADYDVSELQVPRGAQTGFYYTMTPLWQLASDGMCRELYELDCPALPKDH